MNAAEAIERLTKAGYVFQARPLGVNQFEVSATRGGEGPHILCMHDDYYGLSVALGGLVREAEAKPDPA